MVKEVKQHFDKALRRWNHSKSTNNDNIYDQTCRNTDYFLNGWLWKQQAVIYVTISFSFSLSPAIIFYRNTSYWSVTLIFATYYVLTTNIVNRIIWSICLKSIFLSFDSSILRPGSINCCTLVSIWLVI